MATSRPQIQINNQIRDLLQRRGWYDPDTFSLRLAGEVQQHLERGVPTEQAVQAALRDTPTSFFRANRGAKNAFAAELESALRSGGIRERTTLQTLLDFKAYAERQLINDLKRYQTEAPARALLQTYLEGQGRTYREVEAGGGRTDILLLDQITKDVIEAKVWRGQVNHENGLQELSRYLAAEGLRSGFYVVFEFFRTDARTPHQETRPFDGQLIEAVFVHVPLIPPSEVGAARRKRR